MVGLDRTEAAAKLYDVRSDVERMVSNISSLSGGRQFAESYRSAALKYLMDARRQLEQGADPNLVLEKLLANIASAEYEVKANLANVSTGMSPEQAWQTSQYPSMSNPGRPDIKIHGR